MRKRNFWVCIAAFMVAFSACGSKETELSSRGENLDTQRETIVFEGTEQTGETQTDIATETEAEAQDRRMLVVNGALYVETDEEAPTPTCGTMDGAVLSIVAAGEIPLEEGQANFGNVGDGYQYGDQDCLSVPIDGKWIRFRKDAAGEKKTDDAQPEPGDVFEGEVNTLEGVSMVVLEASSVSAKVEIRNETSLDIQFGEDYELQKVVDGKWYRVPYRIDNWAFEAVAYPAAEEKPVEWETQWEEFHGALSEGTYRIVKKVIDFRGTGDYTEYYLAAEFSV